MKRKLLLMLFAFSSCALFAQQKQSHIGYVAFSNIDKYVQFDTATIRVWYALNSLEI